MAYLLSNGGVIINDSREIVNAGVVTAIAFHGDGSNITGIVTVTDGNNISIGDVNITGDLNVSGISTLDILNAQDVNVGGALTVTGDLSVGGDLSFDEVSGRNLNITGISTLGTVQISSGIVTATSGVVTYYGDGSNLTGIDITDSDVRLRNLSVTGVSTLTGDVSFGANASLVGDLTSGRNANLSGIATVNDIYIDNLLYDSNGSVGAAGSILVTAGGKLQWLPPDQAGIATVFQPGNTFFVSKNGDNSSDGLSMEKSFATISYALSQISAGTNNVLLVTAGDYEEVFPLSVPDGLTVKGVGQRAVLVRPTSSTETNDGFQLGNASTVEDLTIGQMFKPAGASNNNYAFTYRSGATISTRGPYVSRVTVLNKGSVTSASDPFGYGSADAYPTTAPGGSAVLADGSVLNSASLEASFLLNEVTTFTAGNIGIDMVNGARVEWLNGFSYFASEGVKGRADQSTGLYGAGKTRLRVESATGGLINGNTIELYDIDGTTSLASGTIDGTSGAYTTLTDGGTGTFSVAGSRKAKSVSFVDTASLSTTQAKFGVSSLDVTGQSTDCINVDPSDGFGFGTGDFTVEFWIYRTAGTAGATILDMRDASATDSALSIRENTSDVIEVLIGNSVVLTSSASAISNSTWHHIAVARQGSTLDLFVDGAQEDTGTQSDDLGLSQSLTFGADYTNTNGTIAYLDELRIEKGAAKYTVPFTPSSTELQGDRGTSILLHLNGTNGATTTTDDIQIFQDIRISGGNTADRLSLADYSQFGAELRSSGCAVEYGNKGVIGDGAGVALRLIGINFSFVGALGDITNDPNLAVQANEITETNNAEVSFTSIDQGGDFRVGESFYVNQETGDVSFNNTTTDLTSLSSLTITDGTSNSLITPTSGRFGNVQISGQQVASVSGDLDLVTAGAGEVNIYGNTNIVGILTAQIIEINALQKNNTGIALDDTGANDGTIRFITDGSESGRFTKDNDLAVTNNFRVGGIGTIPNLVSTNATITTLNVENLVSSGSTGGGGGTGIGSTAVNSPNLNITGQANFNNVNVSGVATVPDLTVTNSFTNTGYSTITGDAEVGGNLWLKGDLNVIGSQNVSEFFATNMAISGVATFGTVRVNNNVHCDDTVFVGGAVTVTGPISAVDINATGVGTIPVADVGHADVGSINVTGVSTISQVDIGKITVGDLNVTGVVTATGGFVGDLTGNVTGGSITIGGSITQLPVPTGQGGVYFDNSIVGVGTLIVQAGATVRGDVGVAGSIGVVGDALLDGNITGSGGTISGYSNIITPLLTATDINTDTLAGAVVGAGTLLATKDTILSRNLSVAGISTFADDILVSGVGAATTDYTSVTLSGLSPSSFNTTYLRQSTGFVLDTGTVASGSALFHTDSNYYYYVASGENSRMLIWSVSDNSWMTVFDFNGTDFSEGNVTNNQALGFSGIFNATVTANSETADGRTIAQASGSVVYPTTNLVSIGVTITTTGDAQFAGVVTASSFVGDSIDAGDLNVSGVATFAQISIGGGGGGITTEGVAINNVTVTDQSTLNNLSVLGVSTFVGVSSFKGDVYIDGNLIIDGDQSNDIVKGTNLLVTGIGTIGTLGVTTNLSVGGNVNVSGVMTAASYNGDGSNLINLPPASISTSTSPTVRLNGDTLQNGDMWYDSTELRQYTYYDDGVSAQWVPSSPEPTIPDLTFSGNTGVSTVVIGQDVFNIVGDGTNVLTNVSAGGSSVTISLDNDVSIAGTFTSNDLDVTRDATVGRNLGVGGTITADTLIVANFEVSTEGLVFDQARAINVLVTGVSSVTTQYVNTGFATNFTVSDTFTLGNPVNSIGIATDLGGAGAAHTALASQLAIKQYIDAKNLAQDLDFTGDTGSGSIGLGTEVLDIRGTAQEIETIGIGNSIVIGLPNTVRVPQRLYVGGGAFTQVMDANSASGVVFANKIVTINKGATLNSSDLTAVRNLTQTGIATLNTVNFTGITTTVGNAFVGNDLSVLGTVNANDFNSTSDASRKENVAEIDDALAKVLDLRGVTFDWKNGEGSSAGVIAQEVEKILPQIVKGDEGNMSVQYNGIIALLVQAVKELSSEVEELKRTKSDKRRRKS